MIKESYADDVKRLKRVRPSLRKTETEKYARYKSADPFPWIDAALLNSADLLKYLLTVGIIEPFKASNLKGVTYQCTFSGEAHCYDPKEKRMKQADLNDDQELVLERNSITYLRIEEKFHVPEYMALRFNLSVSNAYKGLLLGTGPIIDPGFDGNLFIPLHNLTGNEYVIKKGASLIRVEFTKLSRHPVWEKRPVGCFPPIEPITKVTPSYKSFDESIREALLDTKKSQFYIIGDNNKPSVSSSIPDMIRSSAEKADKAQESAKIAAEEAKRSAEIAAEEADKNEDTIAHMSAEFDRKTRNWSIIGLIGALVAIATIVITCFSLLQDANIRYDSVVQDLEDCKQQIRELTEQLETTRKQLKRYGF